MAEISVKRATMRDAAEMAPLMRADDAAEVWASDRLLPQEALERSIILSGADAWTVRRDGKIMGIWGVAPVSLLTGFAIPWLLTTDEVDRHPRDFIRLCRAALIRIRKQHGVLVNRVDARYEKALRWAARLGFSVDGPHVVQGFTFYSIMIKGA